MAATNLCPTEQCVQMPSCWAVWIRQREEWGYLACRVAHTRALGEAHTVQGWEVHVLRTVNG